MGRAGSKLNLALAWRKSREDSFSLGTLPSGAAWMGTGLVWVRGRIMAELGL